MPEIPLQAIAGIASGLIGVAGYLPYVRGIVAGRIRPSLVSWFIWTLLGLVSLTGQAEGGAAFGLVVTACTTAGCALIVLLGIRATGVRTSMRGTTRLDWVCLAGACLALFFLVAFPDPVAAVILSNIVGVIGFVPTVVSALRDPWREGISVYAYAAIKFGLALVALPTWNTLTALYPLVCAVEEVAMVAFLLIARTIIRKPLPTPQT